MSTVNVPTRPGSVTLVVVLTWIGAILSILGGIVALLARENFVVESGLTTSQSRLAGGVALVFGIILALLASALGKGSKFARFIVTIVMLLRLIVGAIGIFAVWGSPFVWGAVINVLVALLVLWLLWNAKAGAFFAGR